MNSLRTELYTPRHNYIGFMSPDKTGLDTQLVSNAIFKLKVGKAADISRLTDHHLLFAHLVISVKLTFLCQYVKWV